jgi:hypothetical protein
MHLNIFDSDVRILTNFSFCIFLGGKKPLTFGKAKRENIRHERFPIDRYVKYVLLNRNPILFYTSIVLDLVVGVVKH